MAKKEKKQKEPKQKKPKKGDAPAAPQTPAASQPAPQAQAGAQPPQQGQASNQQPANGSVQNIDNMQLNRTQMTADEMTQAQIEEAIRESQDPSTKLKKLRSPLSVRGCLLNILVLVVLTVAVVILCCYIMLDHETFNLWVVIKDMCRELGITKFFTAIGNWFKKIFGIKNAILPFLFK